MNCPDCNAELKPVLQPQGMAFDNFAKNKAGDFYCETCPVVKGKGYRHFWTHQLPDKPMKPQYTLTEIISFKLAGLPETKAGIYYRIKAEQWGYSKDGATGLYEIPAKYTEGKTLPAPTHKPGIKQDPARCALPKKKAGTLTLQDNTGKVVAVVKAKPAPSPFNGIDLPLLGLVTVRLSHWELKNGLISSTKRNEVTHLMYDYALKSQDQNAAIDSVLKVLS